MMFSNLVRGESLATMLSHSHCSAAWWGDSLTRPGWTSLVIVWRVVVKDSPSCTERQREGPDCDEENLPTMLRIRQQSGGEILLLIPGWTSLVVIGYTWWGDSLTRPRRKEMCLGTSLSLVVQRVVGEILLLAPGWTSLVIVWRVVGRFSYSPQAGHLSMSIRRVVGRFSYSPQAGHLLSFIRCVVGRFSYSPQAGHLSSSFGAWWGDSLTRPSAGHLSSSFGRMVGRISYSPQALTSLDCGSARGGEILLLAPGWTSLVIVVRAWWGDSLTRPRLDISM